MTVEPCFFFQAEDGIRDDLVTGVQTCALPIWCCNSYIGRKNTVTGYEITICSVIIHLIAGIIPTIKNSSDIPNLSTSNYRKKHKEKNSIDYFHFRTSIIMKNIIT